MISYSPQVGEFISALSLVVKEYEKLTAGDLISGLRILSAMMEAKVTGGRVKVEIVNIIEAEDEDSSEAWKIA